MCVSKRHFVDEHLSDLLGVFLSGIIAEYLFEGGFRVSTERRGTDSGIFDGPEN